MNTFIKNSSTVHFPDINLEKRIKEALNVKEISVETLFKLKTFCADSSGIESLKGLEFATNLTKLNVSKNKLKDISVLSSLKKLKVFEAPYNKISSISVLSTLPELRRINIACNEIEDMSPIANLINLKSTVLKCNPIKTFFLPHNNRTKIDYFRLLKNIQIYYLLTPKQQALITKFLFNPSIQAAKEAILSTPKLAMFTKDILSNEDVEEIIKSKLLNKKPNKQYIKDLVQVCLKGFINIEVILNSENLKLKALLMEKMLMCQNM